jgi:ribosomal-protein-alanine N-acetyltransferase
MNIPIIKTERLTLRAFAKEDAEPLQEILSEDGVLQFFPNTNPPSLEGMEKFIAGQLRHWDERGFGWWAVTDAITQYLLGWSGLQYLPDTDEIEIGYLLKKSHWGKGLATEGAEQGVRMGFEQLELDFIVGIVHPENIGSHRVLEKLGLHRVEQTEYFGMSVYRYLVEASEFNQH